LDLKRRNRLIIGSRGSALALWQSQWVKSRIESLDSEIQINVKIIKTTGDIRKDEPLPAIGGKGLFTKELEEELLNSNIDIAVHSLKDLPTVIPPGLEISCIPARENPHDALVFRSSIYNSIRSLPERSVVGTSSLRRKAQIKHLRPDLQVKDLRGNVDTRLRKLDSGEFDAIVLAAAGLIRLNLDSRIGQLLSFDEMLPAVGQGALGIQTRTDDLFLNDLLKRVEDDETRICTQVERDLLSALGGGCQLPIAGHARIDGSRLIVEGLVASPDGQSLIREKLEMDSRQANDAGVRLAQMLRDRGAESILEAL
jgi:hydroxymethylbilane synthase